MDAAILASYVAMFTGYPPPDVDIAYVPHSFFVEHVCNGDPKKCRLVRGAFLDDAAPGLIFVDMRYEGVDSPLVWGLVVHEMVHAAQYFSGEYDIDNCDDSLVRERKAYFVQDQYLVSIGQLPPVRFTYATCKK